MGRDPDEFHKWVKPLPEKYVCANCFGDDGLKEFIAANVVHNKCSYCDNKGREPIAALINHLTVFIFDSVMTEYELAINSLFYESAEGGYQGPTTDFYDLIRDEGLLETENEELVDDIVEAMPQEPIVAKRFFYDETGELRYTWRQFVEQVTHGQRYVFFKVKTVSKKKSLGILPEHEPHSILDSVAAMTREIRMTQTLRPGTAIYRGREHATKERYNKAKELGVPPAKKASQSRMSAAGIPAFYGALDEKTTAAEVKSNDAKAPIITIGRFETLKPLRVLDLGGQIDIPSIFDVKRRHERSSRAFLRAFRADVSRPIKRDGRIHVEYVPTQIVAEYFRHVFRDRRGRRLYGILYPSAKRRGGVCCVLFLDREDCVDTAVPGKALRLVAISRNAKRKRKNKANRKMGA
jgi:hypothetical protein